MYKIKIILEIAFSSYFNAQQANELDPRNEAWHTKVSIKASDRPGHRTVQVYIGVHQG